MKQKCKKLLSVFLSIAMLFSITAGIDLSAYADTTDDFEYWVYSSEATITNYTGSAENLVIPSTIDGYTVTSIGCEAFDSCTSLISVTIPNSVTIIDVGAFHMCTSLKNVTIGSNVTSIGDHAFEDCSSLISVTIPDSVTSIGVSAFLYCSSLTSVTLGNSVTNIGDWAFYDCNSLNKVNISSIKSWCEISFGDYYSNNLKEYSNPLYYAHNLYLNGKLVTDLVIPDGVTSISHRAFSDCTSLTSVTIPDSVTSIGDLAFGVCESLTSVTIGNSVTSIGGYAFSYCSSLTSVTIGNSVTSIGDAAFYGCKSLTSVNINSIEAWCNINFAHDYSNPLQYARNLYYKNKLVTELIIPDSVTSIGRYAFYDCTSLTSVTIPNSVTSIGGYAFYDCTSLTSVTIGNSVTSIGGYAFSYCSSLTSVTIPNSVTNIGDGAFVLVNNIVYNGTATGSPWGAKAVNGFVDGYLVYKDSTKNELLACSVQAKNTIIPDGVTSIGNNAFRNCTNLTSVTIPNSVTSIGNYAFEGCSSLTSVTISNSVTSIGYSAFENTAYYNDESNWEDDVLYIQNALIKSKNTISGEYIIKDGTIVIADSAFSGCSNLTSITIPNGVTSIGDYAFRGCSSLTSVTIPDSVTSMGNSAFYGCSSLISVKIPDSVTSIGDYAFYNCSSLTDVYYTGSETQWNDISIGSSNDYLVNATIHYNSVPPCNVHKPATEVKENVKKATCTSEGSYDSVVYCSVCKREISRTKKTTTKVAHTYKTYTTKATTSADGKIVKKCSVCGKVASTTVIPKVSNIKLSATSYTYDGNYKKPTVIVKDSKGNKISTSNYTVAYSNNKYVGKASVKITFKGNYSGTKTLYFTINPKGTTISSLTATSKGFKVTWKKQTTQTTGYQIQYSTSSKFTNPKTVTVLSNSTTSKTISKLTAKKKYYVRVRTYKTVNGTKYYSAWSSAKSVTTKK